MTREELLEVLEDIGHEVNHGGAYLVLKAIIELHKPSENYAGNVCAHCFNLAYEPSGLHMDFENFAYPCWTIKTIAKALQ